MIPLDIELAGYVLGWFANKVKSKVFNINDESDYYVPTFEDDSQDTYYTGIVTEIKDDVAYLGSMYSFSMSKVDRDVFVGSVVTGFVKKTTTDGQMDGINVIDVIKEEEEDVGEIESTGTSRTGLISGKNDNIYYISPGPVQFDITKVKINFSPEVYDFVSLIIKSVVDEEKGSLEEKVLEVKCVGYKTVAGRVSCFEDGSGLVDDVVSFEQHHCQPGYRPALCDQVVVSAIRCQRGSTKFRAVDVRPVADPDYKPLRLVFEDIILFPKEIVRVEVETPQEVNAYLHNTSDSSYILTDISFDAGNNVVELISPADLPVTLAARSKIPLTLQVTAKFIGFSYIAFDFTFDAHSVKAELRLLSETPSENATQSQGDSDVKRLHVKQTKKNKLEPCPENVIPGRRFKKPINFVPVKMDSYNIPPVILEEFQNGMPKQSSIERCIPCLQNGLASDNYKNFMHALLYLEEISVLMLMAKLEVVSSFDVQGDFLCLHFDEDSLFTSLLHSGDKVLASAPWIQGPVYEGNIWYMRPGSMLIKFRLDFHSRYERGTEYRIKFHTSRTIYRLNHQAVDDAIERYGIHWLFPDSRFKPDQPPYVTLIKARLENPGLENTLVGKNDKPTWNRHGSGYGRKQRMEEFKSVIPIGRLNQAKWFNSRLNIEQRTAVEEALKAKCRPLPYIIFGPPGTGKSFTLIELILQIYHTMPESRIIVSAPSNSATDVLALAIISSGFIPEKMMIRLCGFNYAASGSIPLSLIPVAAISELADCQKSNQARYDPSYECPANIPSIDRTTLSTKRIILGTVTTLGNMRTMGFQRGYITHVVLDEAAQVKETETLILSNMLSNSGVMVMAGDHKQLGPVVHSHSAARYGLSKSLMERFMGVKHYKKQHDRESGTMNHNPAYVTKLLRSYRSLPAILHVSNHLFYDTELISMVDEEKSREAQIYFAIHNIFPPESTIPVLFFSMKGQEMTDPDSFSYYNLEEVFQVVSFIVKLNWQGVKPVDIGVITPYAAQVKQLHKFLANMNLESPKIGSVEEFQGQERDVIILSTVRSSVSVDEEPVGKVNLMTGEVDQPSHRENMQMVLKTMGFVACPQRMNVALTRARAALIVVGDSTTIANDPTWRYFTSFCISNKSFVKVS